MINDIIDNILNSVGHDVGTLSEIISVMVMICFLSFYEFIIYRMVSHRSMYNRSFHLSIMVIPFFIGAIIMALQSNVVITLGTIGALAIIRYRTAIKDPVDMIYILWSIFVGISCGCQLYELCITTSLFVTIVLIGINYLSPRFLKNPYILVVNSKNNIEDELSIFVHENSRRYKLKSRNFTSNSYDYIYQIETKDISKICEYLSKNINVSRYSVLEYDVDDVM